MGLHFGAGNGVLGAKRGFTVEQRYASGSTAAADVWAQELCDLQQSMEVILRVDWQPPVNGPEGSQTIPPTAGADLDEYAGFFTALVGALQKTENGCDAANNPVALFVVGNEPNLTVECDKSPDKHCTPEHYAKVYAKAREAVHAATQNDVRYRVLIAGASPNAPGTFPHPYRWMAGDDYYAGIFTQLATDQVPVDGIALHAYGAPELDAQVAASNFKADIERQIGIADQYGLSELPVFITEMNRRTDNPDSAADRAKTATFIHAAYDALDAINASQARIAAACWFVYQGGEEWNQYSLLGMKENGGSEPWDAFKAEAEESGHTVPATMYKAAEDLVLEDDNTVPAQDGEDEETGNGDESEYGTDYDEDGVPITVRRASDECGFRSNGALAQTVATPIENRASSAPPPGSF